MTRHPAASEIAFPVTGTGKQHRDCSELPQHDGRAPDITWSTWCCCPSKASELPWCGDEELMSRMTPHRPEMCSHSGGIGCPRLPTCLTHSLQCSLFLGCEALSLRHQHPRSMMFAPCLLQTLRSTPGADTAIGTWEFMRDSNQKHHYAYGSS